MAAVTALQGLRTKGQLRAGQKVLVNGASGGVGTFAVQLAKVLGADVTAVVSPRNVDKARALGADHVIDYTQEDFAQNGQRYDLILAANGNRSIADYQRALSPAGTYVMSGGAAAQLYQAMLLGPLKSRGGQKMGNLLAMPNQQDLAFVQGLLAAGQLVPVIDRTYPLSQVADAIRYLEEGHARGKVVITIVASAQ
jgi:NADPH:quinone reductase-like Zn-dependent oxidoreductase